MRRIKCADLFAGAGGTSQGLSQACDAAGLSLDLLAVNHWEVAVATHAKNHPRARHLCASLDSVDPKHHVRGKLDLLVASPECTGHSTARGGMPTSDQQRSSAWHVIRWAEALQPKYILVENVREFMRWGPLTDKGRPSKSGKGKLFAIWLDALHALGYQTSVRVLNAADYGDATTRHRLFVIARRGRTPLAWPEPTHAQKPGGDLFARKPWRSAREIIDWSVKGKSIFGRKRPLAENTMRRIFAGLHKFGGPHIVPQFTERPTQSPRCHSVDVPLPTVTGHGAGVLIDPYLYTLTHGGRSNGIVEPFLSYFHGDKGDGNAYARATNQPVPTLDGSNRFGLCEPFVLSQDGRGAPRAAGQPLPTIVTGGAISLSQPCLVKFYGNGSGVESIGDPLDTITTRDRFGLVIPTATGDYLLDILFRMLMPSELAAAMSFPAHYKFAGNCKDVVRQVGNAVPVRTSQALCEVLLGLAS